MDASKLQNEKPITRIDWRQVVMNGGPPCFLVEGPQYCGRAERWPGHGNEAFHDYVSLDNLLATGRAEAATAMRDKCVEKVRERARSHRRMATEINYGSSVDVPISPEQHIKLADECDLAADELESLTLDQVKPGEM